MLNNVCNNECAYSKSSLALCCVCVCVCVFPSLFYAWSYDTFSLEKPLSYTLSRVIMRSSVLTWDKRLQVTLQVTNLEHSGVSGDYRRPGGTSEAQHSLTPCRCHVLRCRGNAAIMFPLCSIQVPHSALPLSLPTLSPPPPEETLRLLAVSELTKACPNSGKG